MKLLAVTACPTGISHTYMAAEALKIAASKMGYEIKVETHGSIGIENTITEEDIEDAYGIIIVSDIYLEKDRFNDIPMIEVPIKDAIKDSELLINRILSMKQKAEVDNEKKNHEEFIKAVYRHLMTGVSFVLPFLVVGGIFTALSIFFDVNFNGTKSNIGEILRIIGKNGALSFIMPIFAGYIAYSIGDRPALVSGMVGGYLDNILGAGFLGAILAGYLGGYIVLILKKIIKFPKSMEGIIPIVVLPILSTFVVGVIMIYIIANPVKTLNFQLEYWINGLKGMKALFLGIILGFMIAFDMGGAVNKCAYILAVGTIFNGGPSMIMAAVMAAGMVPPLGVALATVISKNKFTDKERNEGKKAWIMGMCFVTEGAKSFAIADPKRVIPSIMIGSAITSALSMRWRCALWVPHGGIFMIFIPNVVIRPVKYITAIAIGMIITAIILSVIKKDIRR